MYKLCGKWGYHTDKCKNPNNINYNTLRDKFDVCSNKRIPYEQREAKNKKIVIYANWINWLLLKVKYCNFKNLMKF